MRLVCALMVPCATNRLSSICCMGTLRAMSCKTSSSRSLSLCAFERSDTRSASWPGANTSASSCVPPCRSMPQRAERFFSEKVTTRNMAMTAAVMAKWTTALVCGGR